MRLSWSPVTESNRRPSPYHKYGPVHTACLAALMARVTALIALAVLGLYGAPCHAPCHAGRRRAVPRSTRWAVRPGRTVIRYACADSADRGIARPPALPRTTTGTPVHWCPAGSAGCPGVAADAAAQAMVPGTAMPARARRPRGGERVEWSCEVPSGCVVAIGGSLAPSLGVTVCYSSRAGIARGSPP
jgi:hypothetical protein